jgi:hypothetical protein
MRIANYTARTLINILNYYHRILRTNAIKGGSAGWM